MTTVTQIDETSATTPQPMVTGPSASTSQAAAAETSTSIAQEAKTSGTSTAAQADDSSATQLQVGETSATDTQATESSAANTRATNTDKPSTSGPTCTRSGRRSSHSHDQAMQHVVNWLHSLAPYAARTVKTILKQTNTVPSTAGNAANGHIINVSI